MFGHSAYRNYRGVMRNYGRDECLTDAQRQVESTLNKARTFVEWLFAEVASLFPFVGEPETNSKTASASPLSSVPTSSICG